VRRRKLQGRDADGSDEPRGAPLSPQAIKEQSPVYS
jgi:hypothetical protein